MRREKSLSTRASHRRFAFLCPRINATQSAEDIREETLRRIEVHVLHFLQEVATAAPPSSGGEEEKGLPPTPLRRLRDDFLVLRLLSGNVRRGITVTQRDVYYRLIREVPEQTTVNLAIQRLVRQLQVPRQALGVTAGARGSVAGSLSYRGMPLLPHGGRQGAPGDGGGIGELSIPTLDSNLRVRPMTHCGGDGDGDGGPFPFVLEPNTRALLVIEKHAVFYRLMQERLPQRLPCVLLTSHGFPTHAARQLLRNLHEAAPHLPVVGLADYNPSGLAVLLQYRHGSRQSPSVPSHRCLSRGMLENCYSCVPALRWLGLRGCHFGLRRRTSAGDEAAAAAPKQRTADKTKKKQRRTVECAATDAKPCVVPAGLPRQLFTSRDNATMQGLLSELRFHQSQQTDPYPTASGWLTEATLMFEAGISVEVEAMYTRGTVWDDEQEEGLPPPQGGAGRRQAGVAMGFGEWLCQRLLRHDYL